MMILKGVRLKSKMTGIIFEVKEIKDKSIVLESEEGSNQEWTDMGCLPLFFEVAGQARRWHNRDWERDAF